MTNDFSDLTFRRSAKVAGGGYLVIILCGIFAEFVIRSGLVVPGDAAATAANILASEGLFRIGMASDLVMLIFDVIVALALYVLFARVSKSLALLAVFFRLVHSAIYGLNLINLFFVLKLLGGTGYLSAFDQRQLQAQAMFFLDGHSYGYILGLVFFGVHCLLLGYLVYRSGFLPRIIGVLLVFASLGYLIDSFANVLMTDYADHADLFMLVVAVPAVIGELSFSLWLLIKGVNPERGKAADA